MNLPHTIDLFCRVVDNYGDIGVCWRLARQLATEHAVDVTLRVDDLVSFQKICSEANPANETQRIQGVNVIRWREETDSVLSAEVADVVIEAFACELPSAYVAAMATRERKPVWINLEYLSAESWVEGCHAVASLHPSLPLTKTFFFPGFSGKTGGLLAERDLIARRNAFQSDPQAIAAFFTNLGVHVPQAARTVSLFCYPGAPVQALFKAMQADEMPTVYLVPEGVATDIVGAFLQRPAHAGARATRGSLTVQVLPFIDQPDYDKLLWACDLNFVRGEDSFVRAQWAGRPFVWHIYPQDEGAHWTKLDAFLSRYKIGMPAEMAQAVERIWHAWNGAGDLAAYWNSFKSAMPQLSRHAADWSQGLSKNGDLASNLMQFVTKIS